MGEEGLKDLILRIRSYADELGLDLSRPEDRFKWFLASMLFAKRISAEIARRTYRRFEEEGLTTPEAIIEAGWGIGSWRCWTQADMSDTTSPRPPTSWRR